MNKQKSVRLGEKMKIFIERNRSSDWYLLKKNISSIFLSVTRAALLFGLCFLILQPLLNKISVSFMSVEDLFDATVISIPRNFTTNNYVLVNQIISFGPSLLKTVLISVIISLLQLASCTLAGYGFARFQFPLKKFWFACVLLIIIVPPQTIMAPLYLNFRFFDVFGIVTLIKGEPINMLNNLLGYVMLVSTGMGLKSGLYIFMMRQYFRGMPKELEEAAYVDGCGRFKTFWGIMLPDAKPMMVSCFLFSFVWQWTDSFYTTLFLMPYKVLSSGLSGLADRFRDYYIALHGTIGPPIAYTQAVIATGLLMCLAPLIVLYLFAQKGFVESVSQSGIKM